MTNYISRCGVGVVQLHIDIFVEDCKVLFCTGYWSRCRPDSELLKDQFSIEKGFFPAIRMLRRSELILKIVLTDKWIVNQKEILY